jgi:hypothetical protein
MKNTSVYGIYATRAALESGIDELRRLEFRREDISVLMPQNTSNKELKTEMNSKAPEGATTGGATGAVIGGTMGWLLGIGALAIPGLGPFIAAGPIMAALAGLGAGAALGGVAGGLIGMGLPEYEAKRYEGHVREGGILISVHCDNSEWAAQAKKILTSSGAKDVSSSGEGAADSDKSDIPRAKAASV